MSLSTPILTTSPDIWAGAGAVSAKTAAKPNIAESFIWSSFREVPLGKFLLGHSFWSHSHTKTVVQLVDVLRKILVADHIDDAAVLDNVMAVGEGRGKGKILLDQQEGESLLLQAADPPADLLNHYRSKAFGRLVQQ